MNIIISVKELSRSSEFVDFSPQILICLLVGEPDIYILGDPEGTANLYCNFALYWEGCVIFSMYIFAVTSVSPSICALLTV